MGVANDFRGCGHSGGATHESVQSRRGDKFALILRNGTGSNLYKGEDFNLLLRFHW